MGFLDGRIIPLYLQQVGFTVCTNALSEIGCSSHGSSMLASNGFPWNIMEQFHQHEMNLLYGPRTIWVGYASKSLSKSGATFFGQNGLLQWVIKGT